LREVLTNVARHATADHVEVRLRVADGHLVVHVTDDGVGPPAADLPRGHGLANMAARARRLGGSLDIAAAEPSGTALTWRVPVT
jgi:signal transduction histidine kinase